MEGGRFNPDGGSGNQYDAIGQGFVDNKREFFEQETDFAREFILKQLDSPDDKVVLDIGCGAGDDAAVFEQMGFKAVYGVDPSQLMIDQAKALVAHPDNMMIGDYEHTGLPDESVDYVTGRFSLHYLKNFDNAYVEMARVLKPGGKIALSVDHPTADMVEGERFTVGATEYVRIRLYGNSVTVEFPLHNFSDYFSPKFLELFEIVSLEEHTGKDREYQSGPNALAFAARKK